MVEASREQRARALVHQIWALLDEATRSGARGVDPDLLDALTEDLPRSPPPFYVEYLRTFGERFELMREFGYSLTLEQVDVGGAFAGPRFAHIGFHRDEGTGVEVSLAYDLDTPVAEDLDCPLVEICPEDSTITPHFDSLCELVLRCAFGRVRFGDDDHWGGADFAAESAQTSADAIWAAIERYAKNRSLYRLGPRFSRQACFDSTDLWLEARSSGSDRRVAVRLASRAPNAAVIAREQLLDLIMLECPTCRFDRYD